MKYQDAEKALKDAIGENAFCFLGPQISNRMLAGVSLAHGNPQPGFVDSFPVCAPILRGFEGFLKKLMLESGIPLGRNQVRKHTGIGRFFQSVGRQKIKYCLDYSELPRGFLIELDKAEILSDCYGMWGSQRNKYFHEPDDPITININITHENAVRLNNRLLEKIKQSYEKWITI